MEIRRTVSLEYYELEKIPQSWVSSVSPPPQWMAHFHEKASDFALWGYALLVQLFKSQSLGPSLFYFASVIGTVIRVDVNDWRVVKVQIKASLVHNWAHPVFSDSNTLKIVVADKYIAEKLRFGKIEGAFLQVSERRPDWVFQAKDHIVFSAVRYKNETFKNIR